MFERGISKNQLISELSKSPHGALETYIPAVSEFAEQDGEFLSHLIAWSAQKIDVRDAQVALPVISLSVAEFADPELVDNSLAHLAKLSPRDLVFAYRFAKGYIVNRDIREVTIKGKDGKEVKSKQRIGGWKKVIHAGLLAPVQRVNMLDRLVVRYLQAREADLPWFERTALQYRRALQDLYFLTRANGRGPSKEAKEILYEHWYVYGSSLEAVQNLPVMNPQEAAAAILDFKIPFLVIHSALGKKAKDPAIVMAMIDRMSPTEVQTNIKMLERFGVKDHPATRAALDQALDKLAKSTKTVLKTSKAAESMQVMDEGIRQRLKDAQEKQLTSMKGIDGNWLVLGDKSGSMQHAIEASRHVAATLARLVRGKVSLIFFDTSPRYMDATGKSYEELVAMTKRVTAVGGTSIGCGLLAAIEKGLDIDGIAVVSDGGENNPPRFVDYYKVLVHKTGKHIPIYFYKFKGETDSFGPSLRMAGVDYQEFDLRGGVDYYSIPGIAQTMRANRYGLVQEVLDTPLLTVDKVLKQTRKGELVTV